MLEGKAVIEDTDMALGMQARALASASRALDLYEFFDYIPIAAYIKKDFDKKYGGGWQCVVGTNFSCFFTHSKGTFIYFSIESLNLLIFKGTHSSTSTSTSTS
ncbi:dynein light chain 1, cytoplasmic-like [Hibiscus syriacus]|uniref:dynein light chain 1, cytoplasmic-like n=1 Tax=Hibiscus syriacus TaxID=106335 RepID=UPI001922F881|nr:dynein light chain 1, cytoplasmic-like [Hibiscus syriacus]